MRRSCRSWKKHLALSEVTCLSSNKFGISRTPRTRTTSDEVIWIPPSVRGGPPSGIFSRLFLAPIHINSVFSGLSLRGFAAIQCSIALTQFSRLAAADCTSSTWQYVVSKFKITRSTCRCPSVSVRVCVCCMSQWLINQKTEGKV